MKSITVSRLTKEFALAKGRKPFRALSDVSFDAETGETLGIIGSNGAGKSTLLKLLARVLRPTSGQVELRGRVGSLLEVGTGFHPELSGRENIFLNGAMLGMTRPEILKKFDAIVEFAGFPDHLDVPVKHYSSGMYMRLAFAVAAHVEPEILLMDEVLAVGDVEFQRKCLSLVEQNGRKGQTVLLVSHNIHAILRLCTRAVLLDRGHVVAVGPTREIAARYLELSGGDKAERYYPDVEHAPGDRVARLRRLRVRSVDGETMPVVDIGRAFGIEMEFEVPTSGVALFPSFTINNEWGPICWTTDAQSAEHGQPRGLGLHRVVAWFPENFLTAGRMSVTASIHSFLPSIVHFKEDEAISFQALETKGGSRGQFAGHIDGGIRPLLRWESVEA